MFACKSHLSLIKAAQNKQDVGAETLSNLSLITEQAGQAINKQTVRQKFTNAHQAQQPLKRPSSISFLQQTINKTHFEHSFNPTVSDPSDGSTHVSLSSHWCQQISQPDPIRYNIFGPEIKIN